MSKVGTLVVDLQAESAKLRKGLDEANGNLKRFGDQAAKVGKAVAGVFAASITKDAVMALTGFVRQGAQAADSMGKLAQSVGVPTESLSKMAYAANFSGVSTEEMGSALQRLAKTMNDASGGGKQQQAMFEALGVSITGADGKLRDSTETFADLADRFAALEDGAAKTALAQEVFGKSGAKLLPLLNGGAAGLAEMAAEAERFGLVVSDDAATSAAAFNDSLDKLKKAGEGMALRVAEQLTPTLVSLTEGLLSSRDGSNALKDAANALAAVFKVLMSAGAIVAGIFEAVGKVLAGVASAVVSAVQGDFKTAKASLQILGTDLMETASSTAEGLKTIWVGDGGAAKAIQEQAAERKKAAEEILAQAERIKKKEEELEKAREAARKKARQDREAAQKDLQKMLASTRADIATFGMNNLQKLEWQFAEGDLAETLKKAGKPAEELAAKILDAARALERLNRAEREAAAKFNVKRAFAGIDDETSARRQGFQDIGTSDAVLLARSMAGFSSFDEALGAYAASMKAYEEEMTRAGLLSADGDEESARRAIEAADAHRRLAASAGAAADSFTEVARRADAARTQIFDQLTGSFGAASGLVNAGRQGATVASEAFGGAAAAGPWGAVAGVAAALLSESSTFGQLLAVIGEIVQTLADGLGMIIDPVVSVAAALVPLAAGLGSMLAPIGMLVESIVGPLIPPLIALGSVFEAMAPMMQMLAGTLSMVVSSLMVVTGVEPALAALFYVFKGVGLAVLWIGQGIGKVWNGIVSALQGVFRRIADIGFTIGDKEFKPFAGLSAWANNLNGAIVNTEELAEQFAKLKDMTMEDARAMADAWRAQNDLTKAVQSATAAFLNVPKGIKTAYHRWNSADTDMAFIGGISGASIPKFAKSGYVDRPTLALIGEGGEGEHVLGDSKFRAVLREELARLGGGEYRFFLDGREIYASVKRHARTDSFIRRGSPVLGGT